MKRPIFIECQIYSILQKSIIVNACEKTISISIHTKIFIVEISSSDSVQSKIAYKIIPSLFFLSIAFENFFIVINPKENNKKVDKFHSMQFRFVIILHHLFLTTLALTLNLESFSIFRFQISPFLIIIIITTYRFLSKSHYRTCI